MALLKPARNVGQDDVEFVCDVFVVPWLGLRWYSGADMMTVVGGMMLMKT